MTARRLKKVMDAAYERGRADGAKGTPRDPGIIPEGSMPYWRWAYDAGHAQGKWDLDRMTDAVAKRLPVE